MGPAPGSTMICAFFAVRPRSTRVPGRRRRLPRPRLRGGQARAHTTTAHAEIVRQSAAVLATLFHGEGYRRRLQRAWRTAPRLTISGGKRCG